MAMLLVVYYFRASVPLNSRGLPVVLRGPGGSDERDSSDSRDTSCITADTTFSWPGIFYWIRDI